MQNFINKFRTYPDAISFHITVKQGIVSHAAHAAPYHYSCHGTTPLIFENIDFRYICVSLCFATFSMDVIKRSPAAVRHVVATLNICPCTSQERRCHSQTQRIQPITFIFICSQRIAQGECHFEWNRDVVAVGIAVKARANYCFNNYIPGY